MYGDTALQQAYRKMREGQQGREMGPGVPETMGSDNENVWRV